MSQLSRVARDAFEAFSHGFLEWVTMQLMRSPLIRAMPDSALRDIFDDDVDLVYTLFRRRLLQEARRVCFDDITLLDLDRPRVDSIDPFVTPAHIHQAADNVAQSQELARAVEQVDSRLRAKALEHSSGAAHDRRSRSPSPGAY